MFGDVTTLAGLRCRVVPAWSERQTVELAVVLSHGFGAPGDDLVPLAGELVQRNPALADRVRFVFPEAPLPLDDYGLPGGRAWWLIDMERLQQAVQRAEYEQLCRRVPDGLAEARQRLTELAQELCRRESLEPSRLVLGGFSQGAILSVDVALHWAERPAALCLWSGSLVCEPHWRALASRLKDVPVLQSHGEHDPILPFELALRLRDLLSAAGARVEFLRFPGLHEIPSTVLTRSAQFLGDVLQGRC